MSETWRIRLVTESGEIRPECVYAVGSMDEIYSKMLYLDTKMDGSIFQEGPHGPLLWQEPTVRRMYRVGKVIPQTMEAWAYEW